MTKSISRFLAASLIGGIMLAAPAASLALNGDCGIPSTNGAMPTTTDAQAILREAVGNATTCDTNPSGPCVCDVNYDGVEIKITTGDALIDLRKAVGQSVTLVCGCDTTTTTLPPSDGVACTSAVFQSRTGSDLDSGWTGIGHNADLILGASISFRTLRRCSDNQAACEKDSDCGNNDCDPTCDCLGDKSCEVTGPTHGKNCLTTLKDCTTNADCGASVACVSTFGPPLPLSAGGTPVCVISVFDGSLTGTADSGTGEAETAAGLKSRVFLGITIDKPCPRCGLPDDNPKLGDQFTCSGGQFEAAACTVDGVSPTFGGTSFDCPPKLDANVSGAGLAIRFSQVTTGTSTKTAALPCANTAFRPNPSLPLDKCTGGTNPGGACTSNAQCPGGFCNLPKCLDTGEACASNADCKRCTGDTSIDCTDSAGACSGNGSCAEAPDQPVPCGYWCNCGFCNGNASKPCFQTSDCAPGETCQVGPGSGTAQNIPQQKPNDCSQDDNICGQTETERCATTTVGKCSEQTYRSCTAGSDTCENNNAGECLISARPCFQSRITRSGEASPMGKYCAFENKTCTSNSDCSTEPDDFCVPDSSRPETVALFCVPGTSNTSINNVAGIPGPGAVRLNGFVKICRCGDSIVGCDEECDDGDTVNGNGCDDRCQDE